MTDYVVLLPGDEGAWEAAPRRAQAVSRSTSEFAKPSRSAGTGSGRGGAAHSREAKILRTRADGPRTRLRRSVAEPVEQLTGFYLVEAETSTPSARSARCSARARA